MKIFLASIIVLLTYSLAYSQSIEIDWYSQYQYDGLVIQNSYPKGGPYEGPTEEHYSYSYLVFYTRVYNETDKPIELALNFTGDAFPIPNSPDTYVKLLLPQEAMSLDKHRLFSYGMAQLESLNGPTNLKRIIEVGDDTLFYVVALFYQTKPDIWEQYRGENRAELLLEDNQLYYNLLPQVDKIKCGSIYTRY